MAECILQQVGGGIMSDDLTATSDQVLASKTYMGADTDDDIGIGTMPNNGAWGSTLGINGTITIPKGFHNGNGQITQSIATKGATTHRAQTYQQTLVAEGTYCSGNQVLAPVSQNLGAGDIRKGATLAVSNGASNIIQVAGTYDPAPTLETTFAQILSNGGRNDEYTVKNRGFVVVNLRHRDGTGGYNNYARFKINGVERTEIGSAIAVKAGDVLRTEIVCQNYGSNVYSGICYVVYNY